MLFADGLAGGGTQGLGVRGPGRAVGLAAELGAEILGRGEDQRLEGVHGGGAGLGGVLAGGQQDPQGLAGARRCAACAWTRGGQGLAGGADGVQFVGLAATAACLLRPVGLDDQLPGAGERAGQARAVRAAALDCPGRCRRPVACSAAKSARRA